MSKRMVFFSRIIGTSEWPRFDMYRLAGRGEARFVLDVQADLLDALGNRIVVPFL
nr:CcdB family protein [Acetobacter tropicalis]